MVLITLLRKRNVRFLRNEHTEIFYEHALYYFYVCKQSFKKNELKPFKKEGWIIPAAQSASFVCRMEKVLDTYELEYNPKFPVVCMDESPKQIIDYKEEVSQDGTLRQDSEYIRLVWQICSF